MGVFSRIKRVRKPGYRDSWHLYIYGAENQRRFLRDVGVNGAKNLAAQEVLAELGDASPRNTNVDTVPTNVWDPCPRWAGRQGHDASRVLGGDEHQVLRIDDVEARSQPRQAAPGLRWFSRIAICTTSPPTTCSGTRSWRSTSVGHQDVYDGTVPGTNNFVAQGISVHNSLEQDADMVILLHRPDAFERDDPRGGEADLILGKHRNGPTKTITVAHQLHLSRFTNMAK